MPKRGRKGEPKGNTDDSYRPNLGSPSVKEAKELLKQRYAKRGFIVKRIYRQDDHFIAHFGEKAGPMGLDCVTCNWPNYGK